MGIEMGPELHKLSNCVAGDNLDDIIGSIEDCDGGLSIRMICTFSIQIVFMIAFILMFSFLIILNFVFGWLFYFRICLPVPVKEWIRDGHRQTDLRPEYELPARVGPDGRLVWSSGELNVRESICIILRTRPGERLPCPTLAAALSVSCLSQTTWPTCA